MPPLVNCCCHQRRYSEAEEENDEGALQPILALAFVEHDLQRPESNRDKSDADVIDGEPAIPVRGLYLFHKLWRIGNQLTRQKQAEQADRHVDEEDPAPGKMVGDPATQRR